MSLEESFTLLSSMSPKLLTSKRIRKNVPKILSLKKPIQKSSMLYKTECKKNESIILVEESSSETVSTLSSTSIDKKSDINNSTIIISDSENSVVTIEDSFSILEINTQKCSLSDTKFEKVAEWVSKVNSELKDVDYYNSTSKLEQSLGNVRNQLTQNSVDNYKEMNAREECVSKTPDKNVKENNCIKDKPVQLNDTSVSLSLRISINDSNNSAEVVPKKGSNTFKKPKNGISDRNEGSEKSVEDVLDDIYGDCWRENKDVILQQSERKQEKNYIPNNLKKVALTDIKGRTRTPTYKHKKAPWIDLLKQVCDPDTSTSDEDDNCKYSDIRTKLDFEERENISPLFAKSSTTNFNLNKENIDSPKENLFGDVGEDFLSLKDRLLRKLKDNGNCNELDKNNCRLIENNLLDDIHFDKENVDVMNNKKGIRKKPIKRNTAKPEDKKKKNSNRREKVDKIIDSDFDDDNDVQKYNKNNKKYFEESLRQASFLSSLSGSLPKHCCDPSALIFRNNFKTLKDELAKKLFSMYNEKVFDSQIPSDTLIQWNDRMRGSAGFCYCVKTTSSQGRITRKVRIALATKILDSADRLRDTLIHEMCHAASWIIDSLSDGHGPVWQKCSTN
ncbi:uncharacterized protein PFB0315w-like isoform X2 [Agrilus planipennis]|uniref:Uncharacterized protein PFB0315w-like isoform X2 n=1 Tax=Agrilus planipennis TaxID=224129 RepID=A0A7F5R9Z2_AGRPL|nr:uncharacterized protein PFB0315w-like isoform X2 [Agrilus planipennis]